MAGSCLARHTPNPDAGAVPGSAPVAKQMSQCADVDVVVVLNATRVEQAGPPLELYDRPANQFVAGFIGSPAMNFIPGEISAHGFKTGTCLCRYRKTGQADRLGLQHTAYVPSISAWLRTEAFLPKCCWSSPLGRKRMSPRKSERPGWYACIAKRWIWRRERSFNCDPGWIRCTCSTRDAPNTDASRCKKTTLSRVNSIAYGANEIS